MTRQKLVGWILVGVSLVYILYFLKARVFASGPALTNKEWVYFILSFAGIVLGTINVRMAEMKERNQKLASFIPDPNQPPKK
jgi:hypothetical protein